MYDDPQERWRQRERDELTRKQLAAYRRAEQTLYLMAACWLVSLPFRYPRLIGLPLVVGVLLVMLAYS